MSEAMVYMENDGATQTPGSISFSWKWIFFFLHILPVLLEKVKKWQGHGMPLLYDMKVLLFQKDLQEPVSLHSCDGRQNQFYMVCKKDRGFPTQSDP